MMAETAKYTPGGDAQAIKRVADNYFGSFKNMFEVHGWPERGADMMTSAPRHIIEKFGTIRNFEETYQPGEFMSPMQAIYADPPNVWLTSFYGFRPEGWGFLGFTDEGRRKRFLDGSAPGVLVVIYGSGEASRDELGKIIGIQQCSHQTGPAEQFMSPEEWQKKAHDPERRGRWNYAVKATRAWRVSPESRMPVREFAPTATATEAWQHIGASGEPLTRQEALNILKLDLQEVDVYGETPIIASTVGTAREILAPSRAGPVSQSPHVTKEAEGPKHLYILKLEGDTDAFLGEPAYGHLIVKAGFSKSPLTRRDDLNRGLPKCAFRWEILYSGSLSGYEPYPTSDHALAGEKKMQEMLCKHPAGRSLGGEFFLANKDALAEAWHAGNAVAKGFKE